MNNKGQMGAVSTMLGLFIGIIVVLALLNGAIFANLGILTKTMTATNTTFNFSTLTILQGQRVSSLIVINTSGGEVVPTNNYTTVNYDVSTGTPRAYIVAQPGQYIGRNVNVSYAFEPIGYASDGATRSLFGLIAIFAALAVIVIIVNKISEEKLFDYFD